MTNPCGGLDARQRVPLDRIRASAALNRAMLSCMETTKGRSCPLDT